MQVLRAEKHHPPLVGITVPIHDFGVANFDDGFVLEFQLLAVGKLPPVELDSNRRWGLRGQDHHVVNDAEERGFCAHVQPRLVPTRTLYSTQTLHAGPRETCGRRR
jgi:hypothetical protein